MGGCSNISIKKLELLRQNGYQRCARTYWLYVAAIRSFRSECPRMELWHLAREDYVIRQFILVQDSTRKKIYKRAGQ
jgi:hypothetical protein